MKPSRPGLSLHVTPWCLGVALVAALVIGAARQTAAPPDDVEALRGLVFGRADGQDLRLDITRPRARSGRLPVLLCIHGGGWTGGAREDMHSLMVDFSRAGVLCASPDYRLAPRNRFPAQIEDVQAAVRWLRANADSHGIDPDRVAALGLSAGAHLAALLATAAGSMSNGAPSSAVCAAVCVAGPYDLALSYRNSGRQRPAERDTVRNLLAGFLGGTPDEAPDAYRRASPVVHAGKATPPMLLIHGAADPLVPVEQADVFSARLRDVGAPVEYLRLPDGTHDSFGAGQEAALGRVADFLRVHLAAGAK